ncbi:cryptochrome/photolyase family protein [Desulfobulbus alkaliphilus]|uniref:cryptochrome/photolyase family protein n=1 Tax=Desulfobulbus alkaliphilus TaxID=869814 RepID=UPI0019629D77|nr:cryptochrome/photolyase family protein [Desulfobulbus alkaliphilus]MBM9538432.1 cryptochrome/photolyase family protein [Desulfobulbus alkaliphilus]
MKTLRLILGDQLSDSITSLRDINPASDVVFMAEVNGEITRAPHHKQKIVLILSAMRHFARRLQTRGVNVDYITVDDPANTQSLDGEIQRACGRHAPDRVVVTEASEWEVREAQRGWRAEVLPDDRFIASHDEFHSWAEGRGTLRMEYFYRQMRRKTGWLMDGDRPVGGRWNYDRENRRRLPVDVRIPERRRFVPDAVTRDVMSMVAARYPDHVGTMERFGWAVTREEALTALDHFVADILPMFGDYQDAMKRDENLLFHSLLSPYLNTGLLLGREVCQAALRTFEENRAPLAAIEGFIRQIAGWREFIRGVYWLLMPQYRSSNFLRATRSLPGFYWTGDTHMECLRQAIGSTLQNAYAHHIQRLMVTGNFALLAGLDPAQVEEWYLAVYADAFEWVELPNTHGMALFADGGIVGSKPYAASGAYINRMSDYCKSCPFDPQRKSGPEACPFTLLYWYFLMANEDLLAGNQRMALAYRNLRRMPAAERDRISSGAKSFLAGLDGS